MFNDYVSSGKHMICDFKDIQNSYLLNNCNNLKILVRDICRIYDFEILNEVEHIFSPIGCSILFLLSESHISIHTFPEKKHISFDIYTCRQYCDDSIYAEIYNKIILSLEASNTSKYIIIDRYF